MSTLAAEVERTAKKHKAAKAILKWLADLPREDAVQVLQHVGIDFKVVVTVVGEVPTQPNGAKS